MGKPLDYDDCLLLGLWERLGRGQRRIPVSAWRVLRAREAGENRRAQSPTRLLHPEEIPALDAGLLLQRVIAITERRSGGDGTDDVLAIEGMQLALRVPRLYLSGRPLLDLLAHADA